MRLTLIHPTKAGSDVGWYKRSASTGFIVGQISHECYERRNLTAVSLSKIFSIGNNCRITVLAEAHT